MIIIISYHLILLNIDNADYIIKKILFFWFVFSEKTYRKQYSC